MTWSIRVLGTECRTECIYCTECCSGQLTLELTRYCKAGLLAEEVVVIDDAAVLVLLEIIQVHCSNLEHLACTLTVRSRDKWSVEIVEALIMEELVDSICHIVAYAEHSTECIGTWTQVSHCTHELHCLALLLQRIGIVTATEQLDLCRLDLYRLTATDRLYEHTVNAQTGTRGKLLHELLIELVDIDYNLYIIDSRTVVKSHKGNLFATAACSHPASYIYLNTGLTVLEQVGNSCSFYRFHRFILIMPDKAGSVHYYS